MSKNLRWKKLTVLDNDDNAGGSGMDELKSLINDLLEKIDKLDTDNKSRQICSVRNNNHAAQDGGK